MRAAAGRGSERIIGHEIAGVTSDGTPVLAEGLASCGACEWCGRGRTNLCRLAGSSNLGLTVDGGMAGFYRAPRHALVPVPAGLSLDDASLIEPGGVAWHACRKAGVNDRTRVLVVGGGAIGILAVLAARAMGAPEVGMRFGAMPPDGQYDAVIEASGTESGLADAVGRARPEGTVSTVSLFPADVRWPGPTGPPS